MDIQILIRTFGHKYGPPPVDAQIVFDARIIPNPHSHPGMETLTGYDQPVEQFIRAHPALDALLENISLQVDPLITGQLLGNTLVIAIGCKGGRQRSVCVARLCADLFENLLRARRMQARVELEHRDLEHDLQLEFGKGANVYATAS